MAGARKPKMVPGFEHLPGSHCGSTALRNLLAFHGLDISEEMTLGLGAGACFYYLVLEDRSPTRFTNGRTGRLEEQFLDITGLPLRLDTFEEPVEAWAAARAAVDGGRPALLLTDLYHLDHYGSSAHFPGHAVVLAGYDDESAYLSDTGFGELQTTSLESLARARHEQHPLYPLAGHMIHLPPGERLTDPHHSAPAAVAAAAQRMLDPPAGDYEGMPALRRFAEEVGDWPERTEDWRWCARFNYQVIERRGTGGGNFRRLYSRFLEEAAYDGESRLAAEAAERWTELAEMLREAGEKERGEVEEWDAIATAAGRVHDEELELWTALDAVDG